MPERKENCRLVQDRGKGMFEYILRAPHPKAILLSRLRRECPLQHFGISVMAVPEEVRLLWRAIEVVPREFISSSGFS